MVRAVSSQDLQSKLICVSNKFHRIEYESLPSISFHCGRFGHMMEGCPFKNIDGSMGSKEDCHVNGVVPNSPEPIQKRWK